MNDRRGDRFTGIYTLRQELPRRVVVSFERPAEAHAGFVGESLSLTQNRLSEVEVRAYLQETFALGKTEPTENGDRPPPSF